MHLNWVLSILAIIEERDSHLTDEEATYLSEKLPLLTHPHRYIDAKNIVIKLLKEVADRQRLASK